MFDISDSSDICSSIVTLPSLPQGVRCLMEVLMCTHTLVYMWFTISLSLMSSLASIDEMKGSKVLNQYNHGWVGTFEQGSVLNRSGLR